MRQTLRLIMCFIWIYGNVGILFSQNLFFEMEMGQDVSPNTSIHGITKDSLGYIWFGSWSGLYRYDGNSFDLFSHTQDDSLSVPNNRIRNLITDDNQQLWILTFDNQYVRYNYAKDYFITVPDSMVPNNVALLLSYNSNQLNRNKTINGYAFYVTGNVFTSQNINTGDATYYYSDLWQPGALADDYITSFYIDNHNIIWLGSRRGTVYKVNTNRKPFNLFHLVNESLEKPALASVRSMAKTKRELWLGSNNDGMFIYKNGKLDMDHAFYESGNLQMQVRAILEDKYERIWIGGLKGITYYDPATKKETLILNRELYENLIINSVYSIIQSAEGNLWAGLYNGLVKINTDNLQLRFYNFPDEIGNHSVMSVLEDRQKNVWLATEGAGILKLYFDNSGNCTRIFKINNTGKEGNRLTGNLVYTLFEDQNGIIWAGTSEALNRIDSENNTITSFGLKDGLADQYISAITGDGDGNLWIAHKKGISRYDIEKSEFYNYTLRENNRNWVFLDGAYFRDTANNTIYFGAREGYMSFMPNRIHTNNFQPQLLFSKLYISGIEVKPKDKINGQVVLHKVLTNTKKLVLNNNNRTFSVEMVGLNFQNKNGDVIYYKLEDFDEDFIQTRHNTITYSKLPPGNYTLNAYVLSSDGVKSKNVRLDIQVQPPWFLSSVAYFGYFFIIILIIYLSYRIIVSRERLKNQLLIEKLNLEKQEEVNKEKIDFFTNVSHELKTPLTLIIDPIKQLKGKHLSSENKVLYLDLIERNVKQLSDLINQLLDFRKTEIRKIVPEYTWLDGVKLIEKCVHSFDIMSNNRKIDLVFNTNIDELTGLFDKEKLEKIMLNLISNAFKYTPDNGRIEVAVNINENKNTYNIAIKDSGVGIKREALKRIFEPFNNEGSQPFFGYSSGMGLTITKNYVDILGGEIYFESVKNKGTKVRLIFPLHTDDNSFLTSKQSAQVQNNKVASPDSSNPSLLIVEDNPDVLSYLQAELGKSFVLLSENNGRDGLLSAKLNVPDLIISDVMMPGMDGITMCNRIKTNAKTSHIPVILLTAKGTEEDRIAGLKSGADIYIAKPFSVNVLKAQIKSVLENRQAMQNKLAGEKYIGDVLSQTIDLDNEFISNTIGFVNQNIENVNFNAEELAKLHEISQRQLYRKLKAVTGSTVQEFIVRIRMERASEFLLTTQLTVSEIAYRVGFTEPSNFSRSFSKHFGSSPTKYKSVNRR